MLARRHLLMGLAARLAPGLTIPMPARARADQVLHVAPDGSDESGSGLQDRPFATLPRAYALAKPGDTILMRGGTYRLPDSPAGWLLSGGGGAAGRPIRIRNAPGETPVIDGGGMRPRAGRGLAWATRRTAGGFPLVLWDTPYVELSGITVCNGPMGGLHVNGSHDGLVIARCVTRDNGWLSDEHGVGCGVFGEGHANVVRDSDSTGNRGGGPGATGGNADGFQIVLHASTGTVVSGNRSWRNSDDGFDFFDTARPEDDRPVTGYMVFDNWSFENGCWADGTPNPTGDGVGFKLGGRRPGSVAEHGGHTVLRCMAWRNRTNGFDDNGYNGGTAAHLIVNNTAFQNGIYTAGSKDNSNCAYVFQHNPKTRLYNNIAFSTGQLSRLVLNTALTFRNVRNVVPWDDFEPPLAIDRNDFETLADGDARGQRGGDGRLPTTSFLRPSPTSRLRGRGIRPALPEGAPPCPPDPDLGAIPWAGA